MQEHFGQNFDNNLEEIAFPVVQDLEKEKNSEKDGKKLIKNVVYLGLKITEEGKALYLHCLPADITGLSCPEGEVDNSVFDRYIVPLYKEASYKPYIIAAMMFLAQVKDPVRALMEMDKSGEERKMF